jgi:hypothetical protein
METVQQNKTVEPEEDLFTNTPIGIIRSMQAFMRDLPSLLANPKYDRWCACFHGDKRIGVAKSSAELIRECNRRQLRGDQYYIGIISPQDPDEWTGLDLH